MTVNITHIGPRFVPNGGAEIFLRDLSYEFNEDVRFRQSICLEHDYYNEDFCSSFPYPVIKGGEKEIVDAINQGDAIIFWGDIHLNKMDLPQPKVCIYNLCSEHENEILSSNKYINHIIACSSKVSEICKRHEIDYSLILPGISSDSSRLKITEDRDLKRALLGIKESDFLIGMIARLDDNKRQSALIRVMNSIKINRIKAIFIGSGDENYLNYLKSNSTGGNCIFVPHQIDIGNWWSILDCYCMLSRSEGCSAALFESLYFKVPVISTAVGSYLDILNSKNSVLIDNVSQDLFNAIVKVHNLSLNKSRLKILKNNSYETFLKHGDIKQTAQKWKDLILRMNSNDNKEKSE